MRPARRPSEEFVTSAEAARLLHVAPTSIKRWADAGILPCETTRGGHRRFRRSALAEFARSQNARSQNARSQGARSAASESQAFVDALLSDRPVVALQASLLELRARKASWCAAADELGAGIVSIGECWQTGAITILDEHRASERFARAASACAETIVVSQQAPRALLATADGDEHTLALYLAELCLREAGWNVEWSGGRTPTSEIVARVQRGGVGLVCVSASVHSSDARALEAQVRTLHAACAAANAHLVLGGGGAWPRGDRRRDAIVHRVDSFLDLEELIASDVF